MKPREFIFNHNGTEVTGIILNRADSIDTPKEFLGEFVSEGLSKYKLYKHADKYFAALADANMYID